MTAASLTQFALSNRGTALDIGGALTPVAQADGPQRFSQALTQAQAQQAPAAAGPVAPPSAAAEVDAKERARRALELNGATPPSPGDGDVILKGLQALRGAFDAQHARINAALASPLTDSRDLLVVQTELTRYSMLVEISSKLTGKSTQALETLLKGQ